MSRMRKFFVSFSLTVIAILSIYICSRILILPPNYTETSNAIMKTIIENKGGTDVVVFDFRAADIIAQIFILLGSVITILIILGKHKKIEGEN